MPGMDITTALTSGGKYLRRIPSVYFPKTPNNIGHERTSYIVFLTPVTGPFNDITLLDIYGYAWAYKPVNLEASIFPVCSHRDLKGRLWTTY